MKNLLRNRQIVLIVLALCFSASAFAASPIPAVYDRGSAGSIRAGAAGTLDVTSPTELVFHGTAYADKLAIPYKSIDTFDYRRQVVHHLGVLPAIVVALFMPRLRNHYFTINYTDASNQKQVAVFEVSRQEPRLLLPLLRERTDVCKSNRYDCGGSLNSHLFE